MRLKSPSLREIPVHKEDLMGLVKEDGGLWLLFFCLLATVFAHS